MSEASFDFVLDVTLRNSLESDLKEMTTCFAHEAWKATLVLAGSIVEALLLDHLLVEKGVSDYSEESAMSFENLIAKAYKKDLISERVKEQAFLIKRYRNLIHQGRVLRSKEPCDRNSAMTAIALVNMVVEEVARVRKASYGLTAEQFARKVTTDPSNTAVLAHLISAMKEREIDRLLAAVLPTAAFANEPMDSEYDPFYEGQTVGNRAVFQSVLGAYRFVFKSAKVDEKRKSLSVIARCVKEESGPIVERTVEWFVRPGDLSYAEYDDRKLLVDYMLGQLGDRLTVELLARMKGITFLMEPDQTPLLLDALVMSADNSDLAYDVRKACWEMVEHECCSVKTELIKPFQDHFKWLATHCLSVGMKNHAARINALEVLYDPFADE